MAFLLAEFSPSVRRHYTRVSAPNTHGLGSSGNKDLGIGRKVHLNSRLKRPARAAYSTGQWSTLDAVSPGISPTPKVDNFHYILTDKNQFYASQNAPKLL